MNTARSSAITQSTRIMQRIRQRAAERTALANNPMVPPAALRGLLGRFDAQTVDQLAGDFSLVAGHLAELRAKHVVTRIDHRPTDAGRASLLGAVVNAAGAYTDGVLTRRLNDAVRGGDLGLVQELSLIVESRLEKATGDTAVAFNHALYDARDSLDNVPEMQASREWSEWLAMAEHDLNDLRVIATTANAVERLDTYLDPSINALGTLVPVSQRGDVTWIGATEPAGV